MAPLRVPGQYQVNFYLLLPLDQEPLVLTAALEPQQAVSAFEARAVKREHDLVARPLMQLV